MASVAPRTPRRFSADDVLLFGFLGLITFGLVFILLLGATGHLM